MKSLDHTEARDEAVAVGPDERECLKRLVSKVACERIRPELKYMSEEEMGVNPRVTQVKDLKPGMENVSIVVRVIDSLGIRSIMTRAGQRTIGEYLVGDSSGRVKLVAWGSKASALSKNEVVLIENAWVSQYRGEVQANIGRSSRVTEQPDSAAPPAEEIPEEGPKPVEGYRPPSRGGATYPRRRYPGRSRGGWRGGF
ncbi:MAG: single-stranded DNA-binding protein [Thermoprotei archaeon]|nr:MAG: single-stranded DNA-binding protein [Thermoprotei archaeon]